MQFKILMFVDQQRQELDLETPVVIGRSKQADITLGHPLVSRRHCEITEGDDDLLVIEDLGSLNGTVVGEERIEEPVYLEPGDVFSVGEVTFQAVYGGFVPDEEFVPDSEAVATAEAEVDEDEGIPDFAAMADDEPVETAAVAEVEDEDEEPVEAVETFEVVDEEPDGVDGNDVDDSIEDANDDNVEETLQADAELNKTAEDEEKSADDQAMDWLNAGDDDGDKASTSADDDLDDFFKSMD